MKRYVIEHNGKRFTVEAENDEAAMSLVQGQEETTLAAKPEQLPQSKMQRAVSGLVSGVTAGRVGLGGSAEMQEDQGEQETPLIGGTMGGLTGGYFQRPPTRQEVGTAVRYGGPAIATMAASPLIAAAAPPLIVGGVALSAIGGASGYLSSLAGQYIGGDDVSQRKALADAAEASLLLATRGKALYRALFNIPSAIATTEAADAIRKGEYRLPANTSEAFDRWKFVVPLAAGGSYFGARTQRVDEVQKKKTELAAERFGGEAMISELIESATNLEKSVLVAGNSRARQLMDNMGASFDEAITAAYPNADSNEPLRRYLAGQQTNLNAQRAAVKTAEREALMAQQQVVELSTGNNLGKYVAKKKEAADLVFVAQAKKLAQEAVERNALGSNALTAYDVGKVKQVASINRTLDAGRNSFSEGLGAAYIESGIGVNTPVIKLEDSIRAITNSSRQAESLLKGKQSSKEFKSFVRDYFSRYGTSSVPKGEKDLLTLELFRRMQTDLANQIAPTGSLASLTQAQASEAYASMRRASNKYIETMFPERAGAWKNAQELASKDFALRDTPAIEFLRKGDAKGFYNAVFEEGNGQTMETIGTYVDLLTRAGQPEAAQAFAGEINQFIARGVLAKASAANVGFGRDALAQIIDPDILWKELDTLRTMKFPVEQLGLGTSNQIRAAARLSSVKASGGITTKDLNEFLELASEVGANKAVVKMDYYNAVRNEQIANGTRQLRLASYEARQAAKRAKVTLEDEAAALARLEDDPIIQLLIDPNFKVPTGATNSAKFNANLLSMEPKTASTFVEALEGAGRGADLDNLRKGLIYGVINKRKTLADGLEVVDTNAITEFFFKSDPKLNIEREVFRRVVGNQAYLNIKDSIAVPLRKVGIVQRSLNYEPGMRMPVLVTRIRPSDGPISATIVGTYNNVAELINAGRYNTLYALYINPRTAPMWAATMRAGGDLSKQPVLATAIRLAEEQDRKDSQDAP
jgi:hypothetical protein